MKPSRFRDFAQYLVDNIEGLNHKVVTVKEEHFKQYAKDIDPSKLPLLLAVIPSLDGDGPDADNYSDEEAHLMFVLTNRAASDRTPENEISDYDLTYEITQAIKDLTIDNSAECERPFHPELQHLVIKSFHLDPEYNFMGFDGYSISFRVKTYR